MKKTVSILTLTVLSLLFLLTNVNAEDVSTTGTNTSGEDVSTTGTTSSTVTPTNTLLNKVETEQENETNRLDKAIQFADRMITERINLLNKEIANIKASKDGSSTESQALIADLTKDITGLTSLKAQIDAATSTSTISTLLGEIKEIFVNYRVFEVEIPKAHGLAHLQEVATILTNLEKVETNMTQDIAFASSQNLTVTGVQADANKFDADVSKLATDLASANALLNSLTPASYNTKGGIIDEIKAAVGTVHTDVQNAHKDYETFKTDYLALFNKGTETPTPTVSVSPTPTE